MYNIEDKPGAIKEVQRLLGVSQSGIYDEMTKKSIISFQSKMNMEASGITDYLTFVALVEEYKRMNREKLASFHLFNERFPYKEGDMNNNIAIINDMIAIVLKDYRYDGAPPSGKYFGEDTLRALRYIQGIFGMEETDQISNEFFSRLIIERDAIEIKNKYAL